MFFSPKIFFTFLIIVIFGLGILFFKHEQTIIYESEAVRTTLKQDSDNDGLLDWEETLWRTNPSSNDTDNDGISDGEEVKEGSNPLKAGDTKNVDGETDPSTSTGTNAPMSATTNAAQEFFAKYLILKKSGATFDSNTASTIADSVLKNNANPPERVLVLPQTVKISSNTGKDSIRSYGNSLGSILKKHSPAENAGELTIFFEAMQDFQNDGTGERIQDLDPIIAGYKGVLADYKALIVPESAKTLHTELLTVITNLITGIEGLRAGIDDPVRAVSLLPFYIKEAENLQIIFGKLDAYFMQNGVSFKQGDDGYAITGSI